MSTALSIQAVSKQYKNSFQALNDVTLDVKRGEIFALLGPNGAGKTTLISIICGITRATSGTVRVCGFDHKHQYRQARQRIGLVPQELTLSMFESVWNTVAFTRALFGKPKNDAHIEDILKRLSLWEKKDSQIRQLSGGMKRRVLIAKALAHEPEILFLDEPTAGVDVDLRKSMWAEVSALREMGVTIILTTHYIEEAEEMADRIGVIRRGELILTEDKHTLMHKMSDKQMIFLLPEPLSTLPPALADYDLMVQKEGTELLYTYDSSQQDGSVADVLDLLQQAGIRPRDIRVRQNSLEDIFVHLVEAA